MDSSFERRLLSALASAALLSVLLIAGHTTQAQGTGHSGTVERLYALDCGTADAPDQSRWSPGVNVGVPITVSDNCYLIKHAKGGYLLWDTGISDAVAALPDGLKGAPGAAVWHRAKTLVSQLATLGIAPADIKLIAVSHFHPDHTGNVDAFPVATVLIQKAEYDFAMAQPRKPFNPDKPATKLEGDKDVFGDGSVMILSTPGHTPGHQSLMVHLSKTGTLILSGDMAHFQSNWDHRRIPSMNVDKDKTVASMDRVAALLTEQHGTLWINHDKPTSDSLKRPPAYYE